VKTYAARTLPSLEGWGAYLSETLIKHALLVAPGVASMSWAYGRQEATQPSIGGRRPLQLHTADKQVRADKKKQNPPDEGRKQAVRANTGGDGTPDNRDGQRQEACRTRAAPS
jgi:hypothetical protein